MNTVELRITATGAEQVARVLKSVEDAGAKLGSVVASGSRQATNEIGPLTEAIKKHEAGLKSFALATAAAGAAISASMTLAIAKFDEFEGKVARAVAAAGGGRADMDGFAASARQMAAELGRGGVTATGAADALFSIAAAGLKGRDAMNVLRPSLVLAAGAQEDFGKMAEATVAVLNQFGLATGDASRVTNVLAAANNNALGGVGAFTEALRIAGPVAKQMGESIESTASALAVLIQTGMDASTAGTSLRQMFLQLASPTNDAREALLTYGLTARDVNPQMKSLADIIDLLRAKNLDAGTAAKIFGDRSATAFTILAQAGGPALTELQQKLTGTNASMDQFRVQAERQGAVLKDLRSQIELVSIAMGEKLLAVMTPSIERMTNLLRSFQALPDPMKEFAAQAIAAGAALATLSGGAALFIASIPKIVAALGLMGAAMAPLIAVGLAITAVANAGKDLKKVWDDLTTEGAQRLDILIQRQQLLEQQIKSLQMAGATNPGEVQALQTILATTRTEIDKLKTSLREAADAKAKLMADDPNLNVGTRLDLLPKTLVTPQNTEALSAMKKGLEEIGVKLRELSDAAVREQLLPREAEIAAQVDPINQALGKLRQTLRELGADRSMIAAFDAASNAMERHAQSAALATVKGKELKASQEIEIKTLEDLEARFLESEEAARRAGEALRAPFRDGLEKAEGGLAILNASLGKSREEVEQNRVAWELGQTTFARLNPALQETATRIARVNIEFADKQALERYTDELRFVGQSAQLLGRDFDLPAAMLESVKRRMLEVAQASRGEFRPELVRLKEEFDRLNEFVKTRAVFEDLFSAAGSALNTLVQGVILGTQTMGDAFKKLGQSIVIEFANRVIQQGLGPLVKAAAGVVAGLLTGTPQSIALAADAVGLPSQNGLVDTGGSASPSSSTTSFVSNLGSLAQLSNTLAGLGPGFANMAANFSAGNGFFSGAGNVLFGQAAVANEIGVNAAATPGLLSGLGTVGTVAAGVGAALAVFNGILDLANGNLAKFAGNVAGGVAGGVIGGVLTMGNPIGILGGIAIGSFLGEFLGGLFGDGPSEEWLKFGANLQNTLKGETDALKALQGDITKSQTLSDLAQAVTDFKAAIEKAGVGGFVGLTANQGLFNVPGIPGATGTPHEGGLLADFAPFIDQINVAVQKIIAAFIKQITVDLPAAADKILPSDVFNAFLTGSVDRLKNRFEELAASTSSTADDLKAFEAELQAVAQAVIVYGQVSEQIAQLSGDLATMTQGAKDAARQALDAANQAVQDSRSRLAEAITGPEVVASGQQLQKAILDRYALEKQLVEDIEKSISDLLSTAGNSFLQTAGAVAAIALQGGDSGPLEALRAGLDALGETSNSTALRLWAVNASLQALVAAVPIAIRTGTLQTPGQITSTIGAGAGPSIAALGGLYGQATAAGDLQGALGVLGQASTLIQGLAAAAIAGVQQWAQQGIDASNKAGQGFIKQIQAEAAEKVKAAQLAGKAYIDAAQKAGESYIKAIQDEAKAKTDANNAAIAGLNEQKTALQANLATSREWARVADSLRGFITQLELGPQAPPDPMGQFQLAKTLFDAAVAAAPTSSEAAGKVQQSAADLLAAAQLIYTRPSPEYAQLFDEVKAKLESVQATAARFVTPEEQAVAQLESIDAQIQTLNASSRAIQESAQQQIQAVNDGVKAYVDEINAGVTAYVDSVNASAASQITAIEEGVAKHIEGINAAAQTEIEGINKGLAATLAPIAAAQVGILGQLIGAQTDLLSSITDNRNVMNYGAMKQGEAVEELKRLNANVAAFLATGIPHGATGIDRTQEGLHYLHRDEAVLKASDATTWRAGRYTMPTVVRSSTSASGSAGSRPIVFNVTVNGATDTKAVVKEIEESVKQGPIFLMIQEATR